MSALYIVSGVLALGLCVYLLYALFNSWRDALIVLGILPVAATGGILALWLSGTPFSASSGIGFLALFGVSVQTAVVYISYVNELRRGGMPRAEAIREGAPGGRFGLPARRRGADGDPRRRRGGP